MTAAFKSLPDRVLDSRLNKLLDYEQLSVDRAAGKVFQVSKS